MTYKKLWYSCSQSPTILVKTFGTLRVLGEENVIQVDSLPPEQCWVLQVKHLLHILYTLQTLRTSTLFSGGGGILLRPYLRVCIAGQLQIHTEPSDKGEVSQNLLARILVLGVQFCTTLKVCERSTISCACTQRVPSVDRSIVKGTLRSGCPEHRNFQVFPESGIIMTMDSCSFTDVAIQVGGRESIHYFV